MKKYNELFALTFLLLLNINCSGTKPNGTTEKKDNSSQNKQVNANTFKSLFNEIDFSGWEVTDQFGKKISFSIKILSVNDEIDIKMFKIPNLN